MQQQNKAPPLIFSNGSRQLAAGSLMDGMRREQAAHATFGFSNSTGDQSMGSVCTHRRGCRCPSPRPPRSPCTSAGGAEKQGQKKKKSQETWRKKGHLNAESPRCRRDLSSSPTPPPEGALMSDLTRRRLLPNKIPARGKKDPEKHGNSSSLGRFERNLRIPVYAEGEAPKLDRKIIYLVKVNDFERSYQQNMGKKVTKSRRARGAGEH